MAANYLPRTGPGIKFPHWVKTTRCRRISNSFLIRHRHGMERVVHTYPNPSLY